MEILIITGGNSSERKISLISARAVREALRANGHRVALFDFKHGFGKLKKLLPKFDMAFPVMHGAEGEDGTLYQFLRKEKKPFVGSDPKGARTAFDKILFKRYCDRKGVPTARWKIIKNTKDIEHFGSPCVLKAAKGGSSHEVIILSSAKDLQSQKVKKILALRDSFFVEDVIVGVEITVGILHGRALPTLEIVPPENGWFDYKNKYSGKSREIPFAPSVSAKIQERAQAISLAIHTDLKLGNYSRTDIIVKNDTPYVLETNTPGGVGLTGESLFPKAAKSIGLEFSQLIEKILEYSY